nr:hypothetical protein [Desulfobulbaceae bacterium]
MFFENITQGSGSELERKFKAVHSSSALAVNAFSYWKKQPKTLSMLEENGFDEVTYEIDTFLHSVSSSRVSFSAMSYRELWNEWAAQTNLQNRATHLNCIGTRIEK